MAEEKAMENMTSHFFMSFLKLALDSIDMQFINLDSLKG